MKFHTLSLVLFMIALVTFTNVVNVGGAEPAEYDDFASFMDTYVPSAGSFQGLNDGDEVRFIDTVSIADYNEASRNTMVWLVSTGGSIYSPNLTFPGDLSNDLLPGAKVEFIVTIMEVGTGNDTIHLIVANTVGITIIEEGEEGDTVIKRDEIDVFGVMKIKKDDLPDYLQSGWARFGIALAIWVVLIIILWFIFRLLLLMTKKTKIDIDHTLVSIVRIPFFLLMLLYGVIVSLSQLDVPDNVIGVLDLLYRALAVILIAIVAVKVFKRVIMVYLQMISRKTETEADDVLVPVMGKIITVVIWVIATITFFRIFGIDATALMGALGIAGLVIAFGAQDTLSNFFAGIMILLDRPYKEGDWIILDGSTYQVKDIGLRSTRLFSSWTNQMVTLPNSRMSNLTFSNLTEPNIYGRRTVEVSVSYDSDIDKVKEVVTDIVRTHPGVQHDDDHSIIFRFNKFGDSSLGFAVTFFVKDYNDQWAISSDIRDTIYRRFKKEGIEIPFPQRVIHMSGPGISDQRTERVEGHINSPDDMKNLSP